MSTYYLDIETYTKGDRIDIKEDDVLTIQYQRVDSKTIAPLEPLVILKSWESSEKNIVEQFYKTMKPENSWDFIPIGCNMKYDFTKLLYRWQKYGINVASKVLFYEHPYIDIMPIIILCNNGFFKGAKLETFAGKECSGDKIKEWYETKNYEAIAHYITNETERFLNLYKFYADKLPALWLEYAKANNLVVGG
jgi:hypothetical protein